MHGFCRVAALDEVREHGYVLTPGRYVGSPEAEEDGEPFEDKMKRLTAQLNGLSTESHRLEEATAGILPRWALIETDTYYQCDFMNDQLAH